MPQPLYADPPQIVVCALDASRSVPGCIPIPEPENASPDPLSAPSRGGYAAMYKRACKGMDAQPSAAPASRQRPTAFDPHIAERICERLKAGENLRSLCTWPEWPAKRTVRMWAAQNGEFGARLNKIMRTRYALPRIAGVQAGTREIVSTPAAWIACVTQEIPGPAI